MEDFLPREVHEEFSQRMEDEHRRINRRLEGVEASVKEITRLAMSVQSLAESVQRMSKEQERQSLVQMAKQDPDADAELDLAKKIEELDKRVAALEAGESGGGTEPEEYPEYVAGKWYYNGDKVSYNDKRYTCTAPSGVVCVWSPDEYPAYWEEVM